MVFLPAALCRLPAYCVTAVSSAAERCLLGYTFSAIASLMQRVAWRIIHVSGNEQREGGREVA